MVGETVIFGAGAFNTVFETIKKLSQTKDALAIGEIQMELTNRVIGIQQQYLTLAEEKRVLEAKLMQFENWKAEQQRYELKELQPGHFAYALKPDLEPTQPAHHICPSCYAQGQKSILQGDTTGDGRRIIDCPICQTRITHSMGPQPSYNIA